MPSSEVSDLSRGQYRLISSTFVGCQICQSTGGRLKLLRGAPESRGMQRPQSGMGLLRGRYSRHRGLCIATSLVCTTTDPERIFRVVLGWEASRSDGLLCKTKSWMEHVPNLIRRYDQVISAQHGWLDIAYHSAQEDVYRHHKAICR